MNGLVKLEALRAHDNEYPLADGSVKPGKEKGDVYLAPAAAAKQLRAQGLARDPAAAK